jgi:hypothetical protein
MATNWGNWVLGAIDSVSLASIGQLLLAYVGVSLLFAASWIVAVEICRRRQVLESAVRIQKRHRIVVRLALPIAKLENPVSPTWLIESRPGEI